MYSTLLDVSRGTSRAGRRQFHQVGVETVGSNNPWMDVEVIAMLCQFWTALGLGQPCEREYEGIA